jgi:hypothetical protein
MPCSAALDSEIKWEKWAEDRETVMYCIDGNSGEQRQSVVTGNILAGCVLRELSILE